MLRVQPAQCAAQKRSFHDRESELCKLVAIRVPERRDIDVNTALKQVMQSSLVATDLLQ